MITFLLMLAVFLGCLAVAAFLADNVEHSGRLLARLLDPEPSTVRPPREEPVDLSDAWRVRGPLASWEQTRDRG